MLVTLYRNFQLVLSKTIRTDDTTYHDIQCTYTLRGIYVGYLQSMDQKKLKHY